MKFLKLLALYKNPYLALGALYFDRLLKDPNSTKVLKNFSSLKNLLPLALLSSRFRNKALLFLMLSSLYKNLTQPNKRSIKK